MNTFHFCIFPISTNDKTQWGKRGGVLMLPDVFVKVVIAPTYYRNYWLKDCANSWQRFWSCVGGSVNVVFGSVCWLVGGSKSICYRQSCTPVSASIQERSHCMLWCKNILVNKKLETFFVLNLRFRSCMSSVFLVLPQTFGNINNNLGWDQFHLTSATWKSIWSSYLTRIPLSSVERNSSSLRVVSVFSHIGHRLFPELISVSNPRTRFYL